MGNAISVMLMIALGIGFPVYNYNEAEKIEKEIIRMEAFINNSEHIAELDRVKEKKERLNIMQDYIDAMEETKQKINQDDCIHVNVLDDITASLPEEIFFSMWMFSNNEVSIQGTSDQMIPIAELQHNLRSTNRFDKIHVGLIMNQKEGNQIIYELNAILKGGKADED